MYGTPGGETMEKAANPTFFIVIGLRLNLFSILKEAVKNSVSMGKNLC